MPASTFSQQLKIIYSRRRTISVEIRSDGILVRAPKGMSRREIDHFLQEKRGWIETHWKKIQEKKNQMGQQPPYTAEELKELSGKASVVITEKVRQYASLIGVTYGRITIRRQRTRWGSCSARGNLNFNCLLVLFPDEVMDYVVVHELCHRIHMDHSPQFYREVERILPRYGDSRKWLKEHGGLYLSRLP